MKNIQGGIYGRTDKTKTKRYRGVGDLHSSSSCHYYHIPLFFDCELVQKRSGIGRRLTLIGERKFVKITGITPRPFP